MIGRRRPRTRALLSAAAAAALLVVGGRAGAQETSDAGWLPWLGCWSEVGESGQLVCVRPTEDPDGAEIRTIRDGETVEVATHRADGVRREVAREGCEGYERAVFSSDGHRVYLQFDLVCDGGVDRRGTGLVAMVSPTEWIRVETSRVSGESAAEIRRFRPATGERGADAGRQDRRTSLVTARRAAATLDVDDLIEASGEVDGETVRAVVAERGEPLDVDAESLARMADAGVEEETVDVAVAVSFPERFRVERDPRAYDGGAPAPGGSAGWRADRGHRYGHPLFSAYAPFWYRFGRPGWWYGRHRSTVIIVTPRDGEQDGGGRVVSGRGYTRGSSGSARDGNPVSDGIGAPPGNASSRGAVTPSGATAGGSSGSTGRRAKPRDSSDDDGG